MSDDQPDDEWVRTLLTMKAIEHHALGHLEEERAALDALAILDRK